MRHPPRSAMRKKFVSEVASSRLLMTTLSVLTIGVLAACADSPAHSSNTAQQSSAVAKSTAPTPPAAPLPAESFSTWRDEFRTHALASGISAHTFDQAFAGITPDQAVIDADRSQPEFVRPVWQYLESAVSPLRVRNGQGKLAENANVLGQIDARYAVDGEAVVAIWGMESNFGSHMGDKNVIRSLATLAYEGRRPEFGRSQLIAALQIIEHGDVPASDMVGSWAGAMGQTQFIPTTYNQYAVDFDGNGKRDIWRSSADALASTANYLRASGWQAGQTWGFEVRLPASFDYALAEMSIRKPLSEWQSLGVQPVNGSLPANPQSSASLLLPAGHRGPAFLVTDNFRAILRYNNSTSYALAVGLLADSFKGGGAIAGRWPLEDVPLSRSERIALQEGLANHGYQPGAADGIIGANTRKAIRAYQQSLGWPADGYPTPALLKTLGASTP
ncbi:lytic murein transglycosylase [Pseudomonas schmalbachii]|uniref:Lytic murein transglycosylase n=1 Tax=Pseudomonas schmalbachii TaxID=2816993 RepID=A0ABS3TNJ0_9PSED|nr:lytic murein transglycosylase [Pseudomonas schmalbachii]MBO3275230.1 lytic murein transglycosylase [Pseudomonas schmalbachii]